jgi:23S rRNA (adenine2030-N6)-methyltransferase
MQYKHAFHAGNFADVHKHIALMQLIGTLQKKAKGFLYLDTHAGEGLYDLHGADARHSAESAAGFVRLEQALARDPGEVHPAIRGYVDAIESVRRANGNSRYLYPGSPLLAAAALRDVDSGVCVESQAPTSRALQRALEGNAPRGSSFRVIHGDGYHEIRTLLPPVLRRGLVLIDPPYESGEEERQIAEALAAGLERFETGVFAVWYPIKRQHEADLFVARVLRGIERPVLTIELSVHPTDHAAGLNGSGMLIVNPPWQFDSDAEAWQAELHTLLGGTGGSAVKWLRPG